MKEKYDIAMIFDYGKDKIHATEKGSRVIVFRAMADGRRAAAHGAKVTISIKSPDGKESVHYYG